MKSVAVGVSGHRVLMDVSAVVAGIDRSLGLIRTAYGGATLVLLSSLAEGADRLAAEAALRIPGSRLTAVLPFTRSDYAREFGPDGSPSRIHFDSLLARAAEVVELPPAPTRGEGFAQGGQYVLDHCDVLLAIWDGQPAQGRGGTAEVVAQAKRRNHPVVIVKAGNRKPGTDEPTTLGLKQGRVLVERLPGAEET